MSLAAQRAALVTAVDAVTGVNAFSQQPSVPKPGDAWPVLQSVQLLHGLVWTANWIVRVHLPQSEPAMTDWIDAHFLGIVTALRSPSFSDEVEPAVIVASANDQFVLDIMTRSENP